MQVGFSFDVGVRVLCCSVALLLVAAASPEAGKKVTCEQIVPCRQLREAGLEREAAGLLDAGLQRLQAAYALSSDDRLQAHLGRILKKLGKKEEAFTAFNQFLKATEYIDPLRPEVERALGELLLEAPPVEEVGSPPQENPETVVPFVSAKERATVRSGGTARRACVAGSVLLAGGAAGLVPAGIFYSLDKRPTGEMRNFDGQAIDYIWNTSTGSMAGLVLSGTSIVLGGVLVGVSYKLAEKRGSPCLQR